MRSRASRRSVSICVSPGPRVPMPPRRAARGASTARACAPGCTRAARARPGACPRRCARGRRRCRGSASCGRRPGSPSASSRLRSWRGDSSSSQAITLASAAFAAALTSSSLPGPEVGVRMRLLAVLDDLADDRDAGGAQQLAQLGRGRRPPAARRCRRRAAWRAPGRAAPGRGVSVVRPWRLRSCKLDPSLEADRASGGCRLPASVSRVTDALAARLAARTLELIDVPSQSRDEARARRARARRPRAAPASPCATPATRACSPARRARGERPLVLLAGPLRHGSGAGQHPGPDRGRHRPRPRRRRHEGLARRDDRARDRPRRRRRRGDGVDLGFVFFGREELPSAESALEPLLAREHGPARRRPGDRDGADRHGAAGRLPGQHQRDAGRSAGAAATPRARGSPTTRSTTPPAGSPRSREIAADRARLRRPDLHARSSRSRRSTAGSPQQRDPRRGHARTSTTATRRA